MWLDEAWVANSVLAPSVQESLYGGEWLQTSPVGFVLAAKPAPDSIVGLRSVPLIFALLAAILLLGAARRVVPEPLAVLVTAAVLFDPVAIEYLRSFKQFGAELAATSAILLGFVWYRRWWHLTVVVALALLFAYPSLFLVPGLLIVLPRRQAAILAGVVATEAALLYWFVIRPNTGPILWDYWSESSTAATVLLLAVAAAGLAIARRNRVAVVCLSAIVLAALAALADWYPASPRTWLFLRPCFALPVAMLLDRVRLADHLRGPLAYAAAIAIAVNGVATQVIDRTDRPFEGYPHLIAALQPRVQAGDLLLVHANAREGFRLHARLADWEPPARYGSTGWPCCRRNENTPRGSATAEAVRRDLTRLIPSGFTGRVWLVYANRSLHWDYIGLDEGNLWRTTLWEQGCPPGPYLDFGNLVLSPMQCSRHSP